MGDIGGVAQAAGNVAAAGIQSGATISAANTAADASRYAAQQQYQAAQNALNLQQSMFGTQQQNIAPWLQAGQGALSQLSALTQPGQQFGPDVTYPAFQPTGAAQQALQPGAFTPTGAAQAALQPGTFQAPTAEQAAATPGYQFAFDQGLQALQRSQAATGITGGAAAKAAQQYGQGLASTNYQQAYANALNTYGTNQAAAQNALASQTGLYNVGQTAAQQALAGQQGVYGTQFNTANLLQQQAYNRLAGLSGTGQQAVSQLGSAAQQNAAQAGNTLTSMGNALAGGTMGAGLAGAAGISGLGNTLGQLATNLGQIKWGGGNPYAVPGSYYNAQGNLVGGLGAGSQPAFVPSGSTYNASLPTTATLPGSAWDYSSLATPYR